MLDNESFVQFILCILDKFHYAHTEEFNHVSNVKFSPQKKNNTNDAHNIILSENMGVIRHGVNNLAFITMYCDIENHEKDSYALEDELVYFEGSGFEEEDLSKQRSRKY